MTEEEIKRGQVRVTYDRWHYRMYQWWRSHGGELSYGYRENLCHYMRVVLIYVPLFWFFLEPVYKWVRPWMITLAAICFLSVAAVFYMFPYQSTIVIVLIGLITLAFAILVGIILGAIALYKKNEDLFNKLLKWGTCPIWIPILLLFFGVFWTFDNALIPLWNNVIAPNDEKFLNWLIFKSYGRFFYPWMLVLLAAWIWESWYFGLNISLLTIAVIIATVLFVFLVDRVLNWLRFLGKEREQQKEVESPKPQGTGFWTIVWRFLKANKAKICPYIILPTDR